MIPDLPPQFDPIVVQAAMDRYQERILKPLLHGIDLAKGPDQTAIVWLTAPRRFVFGFHLRHSFLTVSDIPPRDLYEPPMPKKFSDLVAADKAAIADVAEKREALRLAEVAARKTTYDVVDALRSQPNSKAAIVNADGTVSVYSSWYGSYQVSTIAGDFEIVDPPAPDPEPEPEPEPEPADDEDEDDDDFDEDDDEDLEDEDEDFRI